MSFKSPILAFRMIIYIGWSTDYYGIIFIVMRHIRHSTSNAYISTGVSFRQIIQHRSILNVYSSLKKYLYIKRCVLNLLYFE